MRVNNRLICSYCRLYPVATAKVSGEGRERRSEERVVQNEQSSMLSDLLFVEVPIHLCIKTVEACLQNNDFFEENHENVI